MRKHLIHLALACALTAGAVAQQTSGAQAQSPAASAPATQTQPNQQPGGNSSGQPSTAGAQPATTAPDANAVLQDEIQQAFRTEPSLANKVNVHVANNQVVLNGTVLTPTEKKTAQQVAEAYAGGMAVVNNINVSSSASAAATATGTSTPTAGQAQPPAGSAAQPQTAGGVGGAVAGQAPPAAAGAQPGTAGAVGTPAGSQAPASQPPAGTTPESGALTGDHLRADIQNALQREPTLSSCSLTTNVTSDSVELAGTCPTAQGKQTAVRLAQSFAGNRRVVDRITLGGAQNQGSQSQAPPPQS